MINNNILIIVIIIVCLLVGMYISFPKKNKEGFAVTPNVISLSDVNLADDKIAINTLAQIARNLMSDKNVNIEGSLNIQDNLYVDGNATLTGISFIDKNLNVGGSFNYLPNGIIIEWYNPSNSNVAPTGWAICNGDSGTPDLRGKFILGVSPLYSSIGETGGEEKHTLSIAEMPAHNHNDNNRYIMGDAWTGGYLFGEGSDKQHGKYIDSSTLYITAGNSAPHENMPPYFVLQYIMKL